MAKSGQEKEKPQTEPPAKPQPEALTPATPATVEELKAALPNVSDAFCQDCLGHADTLAEAKDLFIGGQAATIETLRGELASAQEIVHGKDRPKAHPDFIDLALRAPRMIGQTQYAAGDVVAAVAMNDDCSLNWLGSALENNFLTEVQ